MANAFIKIASLQSQVMLSHLGSFTFCYNLAMNGSLVSEQIQQTQMKLQKAEEAVARHRKGLENAASKKSKKKRQRRGGQDYFVLLAAAEKQRNQIQNTLGKLQFGDLKQKYQEALEQDQNRQELRHLEVQLSELCENHRDLQLKQQIDELDAQRKAWKWLRKRSGWDAKKEMKRLRTQVREKLQEADMSLTKDVLTNICTKFLEQKVEQACMARINELEFFYNAQTGMLQQKLKTAEEEAASHKKRVSEREQDLRVLQAKEKQRQLEEQHLKMETALLKNQLRQKKKEIKSIRKKEQRIADEEAERQQKFTERECEKIQLNCDLRLEQMQHTLDYYKERTDTLTNENREMTLLQLRAQSLAEENERLQETANRYQELWEQKSEQKTTSRARKTN